METTSLPFIGTGWKFPIEFKSDLQTVSMLSGEEQIQNSLDILFATRMGERIMQPGYGSELDSFLFANITKSTITYIQAVISDAILFNEPRIMVNEIEIGQKEDDPSMLIINIAYTISATNNRYNYVFPFYLKEATNLKR